MTGSNSITARASFSRLIIENVNENRLRVLSLAYMGRPLQGSRAGYMWGGSLVNVPQMRTFVKKEELKFPYQAISMSLYR